MKVYYKQSWFGYEILAKGMHPEMNCHVSIPDYDLDKFKDEVKKRFGNNDIEFIDGLENYYRDRIN